MFKVIVKRKLFWTYLVDSYERDLSGITWWVNESGFHRGDKVCLLPTKEINLKFFFRYKPDVIVWNYARNNNIRLIKLAKLLNIYNIIHDTEGIHYKIDTYFKIDDIYLKYIDEVWCWGVDQANYLKSKYKNLKIKPSIKNTGSIRYEYIKTLEKVNIKRNIGKLLWNTNYPTLNPRFQSVFKEYKEQFQLHKYQNEEKTLNFFLKLSAKRQSAYESIKSVMNNIENVELKIRPHPFESEDFYINSEINKSNKMKISRGKDINEDLDKVSLVIQNGCQTVIESFLRGIPSIRTDSEEINIWSKITPLESYKNLVLKINDLKFLELTLKRQVELFKKYKVEKYLNNIYKPLNINKKPFIKNYNLEFFDIIFLIKCKFKMILKELFFEQKITESKIEKLSTLDIKKFLKKKYKYKNTYEKFCILNPK